MLKNFVVQADLLKYYPKLASYLPSTQADWSTQITEAFNLLLDDVRAKEIEPRLMMIPLDLKRAATATSSQHILTSSTETATTTGTHIDGVSGFNRFTVNVTAMTGASGYAIKLQGSNDQDISDSTEPSNWTDIATISPTAVGESSSVFQTEYKYYRYVNTVTAGTPSITYTISIYETFADRLIIHKAMQLVGQGLTKEDNDRWDRVAQNAEQFYSNALQAYKFTIDSNDDNLVGEGEEQADNMQVRFTR